MEKNREDIAFQMEEENIAYEIEEPASLSEIQRERIYEEVRLELTEDSLCGYVSSKAKDEKERILSIIENDEVILDRLIEEADSMLEEFKNKNRNLIFELAIARILPEHKDAGLRASAETFEDF